MLSPKILRVEAIEKYKVFVLFDDGVEGTADLGQLAGKGIFKQWDEGNAFSEVYVNKESGAVTWQSGLDIDTLNLYCTIRKINVEDYLKQSAYATH